MATKKKTAKPAWATKGMEWAEDNDDAHFSDNPLVGKKPRKKISATSHPKIRSKKSAKKKSQKKRVTVKE